MGTKVLVPVSGDSSVYAETLSECLKSTYQFRGTLYQNICDGTEYFVALGFWDFAGFLMLMFICIVFSLLLLKILFNY